MSSEVNMYSWFCEFPIEFIAVWCLLGNVVRVLAARNVSVGCSFGMCNYLPAPLTIFFSAFSNTFHTLIVFEFDVSNFIYFPWEGSQLMPVIPSSTSIDLKASNYLLCAWNSVRYSKFSSFLLLPSLNMMILPA